MKIRSNSILPGLVIVLLFSYSDLFAQTEQKVHITKTGAKYHLSSCRYAKTGWSVPISEAKKRNLTACLVCKPSSSGAIENHNSSKTQTLKPSTTTSSSQCNATTKAGSRCSRKAAAGNKFCWQHG